MKKTTLVAFLIMVCSNAHATNIDTEINQIESQWANIYYSEKSAKQSEHFPALIKKTQELAKKHPTALEPVIWQAIIIATNAAFELPFTALDSIEKAKKLLEQSIKKNPRALDGAALVTLGTLYYMTPGWPISFGDQEKAESLLKQAIEINPTSIDSNYFYADYLLSKNDINGAQFYFQRALKSPVRPHQKYADTKLKNEALIALKNTEARILDKGKNRYLSLFTSAKSN